MTAPRLTLAIENANPSMPTPSVALGRVAPAGVDLLGQEAIAPSTREQDDLVAAIERLCARLGVKARDIGRVAVSVGPGGYTAMRMAVAAGKVIAEVAGARCVPVPSAWSIAAAIERELAPGMPFAVLMACKNDTAFATRFSGLAAELPGAGSVISLTELASWEIGAVVADGHVPPAMAGLARDRGWAVIGPRCDGASCLRASSGLTEIDPAELVPLYAREPEAVTLWRARHGPAAGQA